MVSDKTTTNIFTVGARHSLGVIVLSEDDIIKFAKESDPLPFHTSVEDAEKSFFGRLIASGPHIFTLLHRERWLPMFGHTVIAGLEINHWKFIRPIYPGSVIEGAAIILNVKSNPEKGYSVVHWRYEFTDEQGEFVQTLEMHILHKSL